MKKKKKNNAISDQKLTKKAKALRMTFTKDNKIKLKSKKRKMKK